MGFTRKTVVCAIMPVATFILVSILSVSFKMWRGRSHQRILKNVIGIEAPLPHKITREQRKIIFNPIIYKLNELQLAHTRCNADHPAYVEKALERVINAKNAKVNTAKEANYTLKELAIAQAELEKVRAEKPCLDDTIRALERAMQAYGMLHPPDKK